MTKPVCSQFVGGNVYAPLPTTQGSSATANIARKALSKVESNSLIRVCLKTTLESLIKSSDNCQNPNETAQITAENLVALYNFEKSPELQKVLSEPDIESLFLKVRDMTLSLGGLKAIEDARKLIQVTNPSMNPSKLFKKSETELKAKQALLREACKNVFPECDSLLYNTVENDKKGEIIAILYRIHELAALEKCYAEVLEEPEIAKRLDTITKERLTDFDGSIALDKAAFLISPRGTCEWGPFVQGIEQRLDTLRKEKMQKQVPAPVVPEDSNTDEDTVSTRSLSSITSERSLSEGKLDRDSTPSTPISRQTSADSIDVNPYADVKAFRKEYLQEQIHRFSTLIGSSPDRRVGVLTEFYETHKSLKKVLEQEPELATEFDKLSVFLSAGFSLEEFQIAKDPSLKLSFLERIQRACYNLVFGSDDRRKARELGRSILYRYARQAYNPGNGIDMKSLLIEVLELEGLQESRTRTQRAWDFVFSGNYAAKALKRHRSS